MGAAMGLGAGVGSAASSLSQSSLAASAGGGSATGTATALFPFLGTFSASATTASAVSCSIARALAASKAAQAAALSPPLCSNAAVRAALAAAPASRSMRFRTVELNTGGARLLVGCEGAPGGGPMALGAAGLLGCCAAASASVDASGEGASGCDPSAAVCFPFWALLPFFPPSEPPLAFFAAGALAGAAAARFCAPGDATTSGPVSCNSGAGAPASPRQPPCTPAARPHAPALRALRCRSSCVPSASKATKAS